MAQMGDRLQGAVLRQQRKQIGFPTPFKRVSVNAPMRDLAVGRQRRVSVNASGTAFAEPGPSGCASLTAGLDV